MPEKEAAHKINNFITAPQVRVVGDNIEQPEVMSLRDALNKADEMGLDLVEISPKNDPTTAKTIANTFVEKGADVIFHASGASGMGMFQAAEEKGERDQIEDRQGGGQGDPFRAQYRRPRLRF